MPSLRIGRKKKKEMGTKNAATIWSNGIYLVFYDNCLEGEKLI